MKARLSFCVFVIALVMAAAVVAQYFFTPSAAATLIFVPLAYLGITTGLSVWLSRIAERRGRALSLMNWVLIGAAVVLLIPSGAIFVWAWMM